MKYQQCVLLPIALLLLGTGLVMLLYFGIGKLEPYTHTKDFRSAQCIVIYSNVSGIVTCNHEQKKDSDKVIHSSVYPCLEIVVNYTEEKYQAFAEDDQGIRTVTVDDVNNTRVIYVPNSNIASEDKDDIVRQSSVLLYNAYDSWSLQHRGGSNGTCSVHVCESDIEHNKRHVSDFLEDYGEVGKRFQCFFNPRNKREVYSKIVKGNLVFHAMIWPALAMCFGLFLLVVVAFLSCEVWICMNPKRAQRRMEGQTYELATYRENLRGTRRGWRDNPNEEQNKQRGPGDGNNNSRLPKLSAAADIVRKWSMRGRSGSSSRNRDSDTGRSSRSFGGDPSRQWSLAKEDRTFCTT